MLSHGGGLLPLLSGARQMREQTGELGREVLVDFTAQRSGDIKLPAHWAPRAGSADPRPGSAGHDLIADWCAQLSVGRRPAQTRGGEGSVCRSPEALPSRAYHQEITRSGAPLNPRVPSSVEMRPLEIPRLMRIVLILDKRLNGSRVQ